MSLMSNILLTFKIICNMKTKFETSSEMIGKYLNKSYYSHINVIGRIVGIKSRTIVYVKRVIAELDPNWRPELVTAGFSAICLNQYSQQWIYTETDEVFEKRLSASELKKLKIQDKPQQFYNFNF